MPIAEYEIYAFLLGAAAGSIGTYYITTREKRIISRVRGHIDTMGAAFAADALITEQQYRSKILHNTELVTDKQILEIYDWAERAKKEWKLKTSLVNLTVLRILCEELLGLAYFTSVQAAEVKKLGELITLLRSKVSAKNQDNRTESLNEKAPSPWKRT